MFAQGVGGAKTEVIKVGGVTLMPISFNIRKNEPFPIKYKGFVICYTY